MYAIMQFGKMVSRYTIYENISSDKVWTYFKDKFSIKPEHITQLCDINFDSKNREEKTYTYIININKPFKLLFIVEAEERYSNELTLEDSIDKINNVTNFIIYYEYGSSEFVEDIVNDIKNMVKHVELNRTFYVITSNSMGYALMPAKIHQLDIDLGLNYGDDFVDKYKDIINKLKTEKKGLFLFHGDTGTGKTTIIRKIISDLANDKTIIYIPSYFVWDIANPELISFISKYKNSILLIEDAEMILSSEQENRNQAVSNILNISDGLLNDHMNMQIIATFNINKKILDNALLRKGRLTVDYKFKKLNSDQATLLSEHLGLNKKYTEPKSLAEIYEEKGFSKQLIENEDKTKKIGF